MGLPLAHAGDGVVEVGCIVILAIETSVEAVGVALVDHTGVKASASIASDRRHAESLVPLVQFVMEQSGTEMATVSAIAVDVGPGLFTGMRVGIATAQALAWAVDLPVVPVCSLDALAYRVRETDDLVAAALDARRDEVYWALYKSSDIDPVSRRLVDPVVGSPEDLAVHLADRAEPVLCVGTGFHRYRDTFESLAYARFAGDEMRFPDAGVVGRMALSVLANDGAVSADAIEPMYLRPPDATINWSTRGGAR